LMFLAEKQVGGVASNPCAEVWKAAY